MTSPYNLRRGTFQHITLEGTPYEIGRKQAELLSENKGFLEFFTSGQVDPGKYGYASFQQVKDEFEVACPGINEEIQGFADGLNVPVEKILFYDFSHTKPTNCSHMVALPPITRDGHVLVGRSYEWKPEEEDLRLCTTQVTGKARHIGFSCLIFGRMEGMNEYGLSITMSGGMAAGLPWEWNKRSGLFFWVVLRGILDTCHNVTEALAMLRAATPTTNSNLLLADRSGRAVLAEIAQGDLEVKEIDSNATPSYLVSANHFTLGTLPSLHRHKDILEWSLPRYAAIQACIEADTPNVSRETFREVLTREVPNGCMGPYYSGGFGTLWSMIFDLTLGEVEICFGAPGFNEWHTFTLEGSSEVTEYQAIFPDKA